MTETIAVLRNGSGLDLDRYVARVFRDAETAHRWLNKQSANYNVRRIDGKRKAGERIPFGTATRPLTEVVK